MAGPPDRECERPATILLIGAIAGTCCTLGLGCSEGSLADLKTSINLPARPTPSPRSPKPPRPPSSPGRGAPPAPGPPGAPGVKPPLFQDGFESGLTDWTLVEVLSGQPSCVATETGEVALSSGVAFNGVNCLRVHANRQRSELANHVAGRRRISWSGLTGRWRSRVLAWVPHETAATGQLGPQVGMLNAHRLDAGGIATVTAAIRYQASPFASPAGAWEAWCAGSGGNAAWIAVMTQPLQSGVWYELVLDADFDAGSYTRFELRGPGLERTADLTGRRLVPEALGAEEGFWLSLEAQSLWSNCGTAGRFDYIVLHDDVELRRVLE
jgi:hypothetical protein